jgi:hypothetical protein
MLIYLAGGPRNTAVVAKPPGASTHSVYVGVHHEVAPGVKPCAAEVSIDTLIYNRTDFIHTKSQARIYILKGLHMFAERVRVSTTWLESRNPNYDGTAHDVQDVIEREGLKLHGSAFIQAVGVEYDDMYKMVDAVLMYIGTKAHKRPVTVKNFVGRVL